MQKFFIIFATVAFALYGICLAEQNIQTNHSIKVVAFDFGGVVATVDKNKVEKFLMESFHVSKEELEPLFDKWKKCLIYGEDEKKIWEDYAKERGVTLPIGWFIRFEDLKTFAFIEIPDTVTIVKELQHRGYITPMLSNVTKCHADVIRKLGYYELFKPVLLSYEIGVEKPNPRAYEILLQSLNTPASSVIFVDDRIENIEAANQLGMRGIHFTGAKSLVDGLKKEGIEINFPIQN